MSDANDQQTLKPEVTLCPWCGKPCTQFYEFGFLFKCMNRDCPIRPTSPIFGFRGQLVTAWNTRHDDAALTAANARIKELEGQLEVLRERVAGLDRDREETEFVVAAAVSACLDINRFGCISEEMSNQLRQSVTRLLDSRRKAKPSAAILETLPGEVRG